MENNTENNIESDIGKKKNNSIMIIIIILILAIIVIIVFRKINPKIETEPLSQSEKDLNQAAAFDTTASINSNLNNINLDDTTSADLAPVDQELGNL